MPFHSNMLSELKTNLSLRVCVWCCSHGFWFHGRIQGYSCTCTWLLHGSLLVSDLKETSCALFLQATQRRSDWPLRTSSTLTRQPIASRGSSYQLDMPSRFIETSTTAHTTGFKQRETSSYRLQSELEGSFIPKDYNRECKSCGQFSHLVFSFFSFTSLVSPKFFSLPIYSISFPFLLLLLLPFPLIFLISSKCNTTLTDALQSSFF